MTTLYTSLFPFIGPGYGGGPGDPFGQTPFGVENKGYSERTLTFTALFPGAVADSGTTVVNVPLTKTNRGTN